MDSNRRPPVRRSSPGTASLVLGAWASAVFVVLWAGAIVGLLGDGRLFADAWAWLTGLPLVGQVVAWILFLPACVALWAIDAGWPGPVMVLLGIGLVAWTAVAWGGFARTLVARRGAQAAP